MSESLVLPIDAVITWVDGRDPVHKAKMEACISMSNEPRPSEASPTRFHCSGEINFCVVSLLKFAPWLRKIFIVTDDQIPGIAATLANTSFANRVQVIDHREIFQGFED